MLPNVIGSNVPLLVLFINQVYKSDQSIDHHQYKNCAQSKPEVLVIRLLESWVV